MTIPEEVLTKQAIWRGLLHELTAYINYKIMPKGLRDNPDPIGYWVQCRCTTRDKTFTFWQHALTEEDGKLRNFTTPEKAIREAETIFKKRGF
jgi:hypothetical protein